MNNIHEILIMKINFEIFKELISGSKFHISGQKEE